MTTIAIDERMVAADGKRTDGSEIIELAARKIRVAHGRIYAITGEARAFGPAIEWHNDGAQVGLLPPCGKDSRWTLIVIESAEDGRYRLSVYGSDSGLPDVYPIPQTFGSGASYAMGAMRVGASARQAVEAAIGLDVHSGGEIQVVDIRRALGESPHVHSPAFFDYSEREPEPADG